MPHSQLCQWQRAPQSPAENGDRPVSIVLYVADRSIGDNYGLFEGSSQVATVLLQQPGATAPSRGSLVVRQLLSLAIGLVSLDHSQGCAAGPAGLNKAN